MIVLSACFILCPVYSHCIFSSSLLLLLHHSITIGRKFHNIIVGRREFYIFDWIIGAWRSNINVPRGVLLHYLTICLFRSVFSLLTMHILPLLLSLLHYSITIVGKLHNIIVGRREFYIFDWIIGAWRSNINVPLGVLLHYLTICLFRSVSSLLTLHIFFLFCCHCFITQ